MRVNNEIVKIQLHIFKMTRRCRIVCGRFINKCALIGAWLNRQWQLHAGGLMSTAQCMLIQKALQGDGEDRLSL